MENITSQLLFKLINNLNKPHNKKIIELNIINPILCIILKKAYPYIILLLILYGINLLLIIVLIIGCSYKTN